MPIQKCEINGKSGYKWGSQGKCYPGTEGRKKAEAQAKAAYTSGYKGDSVLFTDTAQLKATIDETSGFLTSPVTLARTGVQEYFGFELGLMDGEDALKKFGVFRPAEEVFHKDSIASYINLVITDDHPGGFVTVENVKDLQVGTVSHVSANVGTLEGIATITNKDQIDKSKDGKIEVSVGYSNDLKEEAGVFDGLSYQYKQTKIRANHLAIVDKGRCGNACKLTLDKQQKEEVNMEKVTIDGIEFDVEDKQLVQAIKKMQATHDQEKEAAKKKEEMDQEEKEELKKKADKAKATKDALEKSTLSDEAISKLVSDRATLIADARMILGDKFPTCDNCPVEIKTAVVEYVIPDMDLTDKSDEYLNAAYDMALAKAKKTSKNLNQLGDELANKDKLIIDRDAPRLKYMKDHLGLVG